MAYSNVETFNSIIESSNPLDAGVIETLRDKFENMTPEQQGQVIMALDISREDHLALRKELSSTGQNSNETQYETAPDTEPAAVQPSVPVAPISPNNPSIPKNKSTPLVSPEGVFDTNLLVGENLPKGITQEFVLDFFLSAYLPNENKDSLNNEVIIQKIKEYQEAHGLSIDGKIGSHTYAELLAESYYTTEKYEEFVKDGINTNEQKRILDILSYANHGSLHIEKLHIGLGRIKPILETQSDYDVKYKIFFEKVDAGKQNFAKSPAGIEVQKRANEKVDDIYTMAEEGRYGDIIKDPTLLMAGAVLFLFGVIGGNTKYTDSFLKRIGWLVGGALFGPKLWKKLGGDKMLADAKGFWNSPEHAENFAKGKEATISTLSSWASKVPGVDLSVVGDKYDTFKNKVKNFHSDRVKNSLPVISDDKVGALLLLTGLESFSNLPKSKLETVNSYDELISLLSDSDKEKLQKAGLSSDDSQDVKLYIQEYFLPQMGEDDAYVRDMFFTTKAIDAVTGVISGFNGNLNIESPAQKEIIMTGFSNILNSPGRSDNQKHAAQKLREATQSGDVSRFKLDDYTTLADTEANPEKAELQQLIDQITHIFRVQAELIKSTQSVTDITVASSGTLKDTETTLKEKYDLLEKAQGDFDTYMDGLDVSIHGISKDSFDLGNFETTYQAKKQEILNYAFTTLKLNEFGGKNKSDAEKEAETVTLISEAQELSEKISEDPVPGIDKTPVEMRDWYDRNHKNFERLQDIGIELIDIKVGEVVIGTDTINEMQAILARMDEFEENYEKVREETMEKGQEIITELEMIGSKPSITPDQFTARKKEITDLLTKYIVHINSIQPSVGLIAPALWKDLFSYEEFVGSQETNAIVYLDSIAEPDNRSNDVTIVDITEKLRASSRKIEHNFSVDVGIENVDISDPNTIDQAVRSLQRLDIIVSRGSLSFANTEDILPAKRKEIADQITALNQKFIDAIKVVTSADELGIIEGRYKVFLEGKFSSFWKSLGTAVGVSTDSVTEAIRVRREKLIGEAEKIKKEEEEAALIEKRKPILSKKIGNPEIKELQDMIVTFFQNNRNIPEIKAIEDNLKKATSAPTIGDVLMAIKGVPDNTIVSGFLEDFYKKID